MQKRLSDACRALYQQNLRHLKSLTKTNAKSATENGLFITDTIASWIKKGFVMGPYDEEPPFEEFRANPLIEIVQK
jgi:hypothetical protein